MRRLAISCACAVLAIGCYESHVREGLDPTTIEAQIREDCGERCGGRIVDVDVGSDHSCALYDAGGVVCWGRIRGVAEDPEPVDDYGDIVALKLPPVAVRTLPPVVEIDLGSVSACARTTDGAVYCWARALYRRSGEPPPEGTRVPVRIRQDPDVVRMDLGTEACATLEDGRVRIWDFRDGIPTVPAIVEGIDDAVSCVGEPPRCVLRRDGTVACHGTDLIDSGGAGWVPVVGVSHVTQIDTGGRHACALRSDGTVHCWGDIAPSPDHAMEGPRPVEPVPELAAVVAIAVSYTGRYCAVRANGTVACWGVIGDWMGRDLPYEVQEVPYDIEGLEDIVDVDVGVHHACALSSAGRVYCWGKNDWGQGGFSPSIAFSQQPRPVLGLPR